MSTVFISHSHRDKPFVNRLREDLERHGHYTWIDDDEIKVGDSLLAKIRDGIDYVDFFLVVLSSASVSSEWVRRELDVALSLEIARRERFVLPLIAEHVALPSFLEGKLYADFSVSEQYEDALMRLLRSLTVENPKRPELRERITLDARTICRLRKELLYAVNLYGTDVIEFMGPDDLNDLIETLEIDKAAAEGYVNGLRFLIDALVERSDEQDSRRAVMLSAAILTNRISSIFHTGSDLRVAVKTDKGQIFGYEDEFRNIAFPQEWQFADKRVRHAFREGDLKIYYAGAALLTKSLVSLVSDQIDKSIQPDNRFFLSLLYSALHIILRKTEEKYFKWQLIFWNMVENILRPRFGLPQSEGLAEATRQAAPTFEGNVFKMLELRDETIQRYATRAKNGDDAWTAMGMLMLELKARFVFTGTMNEDGDEPVWNITVEKE